MACSVHVRACSARLLLAHFALTCAAAAPWVEKTITRDLTFQYFPSAQPSPAPLLRIAASLGFRSVEGAAGQRRFIHTLFGIAA
jgi:hypothetical protein